jgi:DNA-binding CsgD family transcriptional regulator
VGHPELTKRELEVLQYIAIAAKRGLIHPNT